MHKNLQQEKDEFFAAHAICEWRQVLNALFWIKIMKHQISYKLWFALTKGNKKCRENNCDCKQSEAKSSLKIIYAGICFCHIKCRGIIFRHCTFPLLIHKLDAEIMHQEETKIYRIHLNSKKIMHNDKIWKLRYFVRVSWSEKLLCNFYAIKHEFVLHLSASGNSLHLFMNSYRKIHQNFDDSILWNFLKSFTFQDVSYMNVSWFPFSSFRPFSELTHKSLPSCCFEFHNN